MRCVHGQQWPVPARREGIYWNGQGPGPTLQNSGRAGDNVSNPELARLRALAAVIRRAETTLDVAYRSLQESATALLQTGEATLAEVSEASGLDQGDLLELLSRSTPGREPSWKQP